MPEVLKKTAGAMVAFGDVVQLWKESSQDPEADGFERYIGLEHLEPLDLKVRSWGDISDGVTFTSVFRPGQVLFGKRRAYQRKVAVAGFSGVCSGDIYVLEPKGDQLLPELLPFICQSEPFYDYVISMSQGGLSPRVKWEALAKYEFILPSLEEQRRLVEVLEAARNSGERSVELTNRARAVWLSSLESLWGDRRLQLQSVGDLVADIVPGRSVVGSNRPPQEGEVAVLKVSAVDPLGFRPDESKVLTDPTHFLPDFGVSEGDLLMTRANTSALVGETCIVDRWYLNLMLSDKTLRLVAGDGINKRLLWHLMQSQSVRQQVSAVSTGTGGAMKNISQAKIRALEIPYPSGPDVAKSLCDFLDQGFAAMKNSARRSEAARNLSRVLVNALLEGPDQ